MSSLEAKETILKYPQKEKAFVISADKNAPFRSAIIGITYPDPSYHIDRPRIDDLTVFEYVTEGEGEILIDGEWRRARAGDTYILAPGEEHRYRSCAERPWKKLWVNYISDYMSSYLDAFGIKTGIFRIGALPYFERLEALSQRGELDRTNLHTVAECIHNIIALIAESRSETNAADRIKELLLGAVYGKISLDSIADTLHISKSGVIRIFKRKFGITPYEFLMSSKIDVAKMLLRTTSLSVRQIAEKLEILDEHYFSTLFATRVGVRPLKYRRSGK